MLVWGLDGAQLEGSRSEKRRKEEGGRKESGSLDYYVRKAGDNESVTLCPLRIPARG